MPRSVWFDRFGGPEVLYIQDRPIREPGPDEVRIKVKAIGVNRSESLLTAGFHQYPPALPSQLGWEASGLIDAVGANVGDGLALGQAVSVIPQIIPHVYATYQEFITLPADFVVANPANLSHVEAAGLWTSFLTAHGGLIEIGGLQRGETILITAAACSVGLSAIQIARWVGATVIATTRNPAKVDALLAAGAHHVVVTSAEDLAERVMEITGGAGARIAFDPVGGPGVTAIAASMARFGAIIEYGLLSNEETPFPLFAAIVKGLSMRGYSQDDMNRDAGWRARAIDFVLKGVAEGALRPKIDRVFPLGQVVDVHRYLLGAEQVGKIVMDASL